MNHDAISAFLGSLERQEVTLLSWGMVDGSFSNKELEEKAERFLDEHNLWETFSEPDDLIEEMEKRRLIFSFETYGERRYRTRMAETVRLLSRLRQLFPKHLSNSQWRNAPTLVADFRFLIRPRVRPDWYLPPQDVIDRIDLSTALSDTERSVIEALLDTGSAKPIMLADFQFDASRSILTGIRGGPPSGTIICAGTGSGKTLAFYLPALAAIASAIDVSNWTKCLAIYPRKELLKDQFSEIFRQARKIDAALSGHNKRRLTIGALYGATPNTCFSLVPNNLCGWERASGGYVCPFLRCPTDGCRGQLVWSDEDRKIKSERLCCNACGTRINDDEIFLTRTRMQKSPPDILFTTTEMLNRCITDSWYGNLLGIRTNFFHKPMLVMLDEVHTYSEVHGAQVAMLLRRWKQASGAKPHFVGLSATLMEAKSFFATLAGLNENRVTEVSPVSGKIVYSAMEYLLALRGDPVSQTGLLSTTIQTAMLLIRSLDTHGGQESGGLYGSKAFLFTDDLDVTNRLYFDLLDAEGLDSWNRPSPRRSDSLANLRSSCLPEHGDRFRLGQSWDICEEIGHSLGPGNYLSIGRTSSQDIGVSAEANIVVATAALEVGFNDPNVNAIIQHKAPRGVAQFLQRKGRAGRKPQMRPWTVVVLSDYGRDRIAYQGYDLLFDPELPPQKLPIANIYVLKMQATYAFMDWLAKKLGKYPKGSLWKDLAGPWGERRGKEQEYAKARQKIAADVIEDVLVNEQSREELAVYLKHALQVDSKTVQAMFWDPPRALLTAALPTLLRRLRSGWRCAMPAGSATNMDYMVRDSPLPDFIPPSLFSDLALPEVVIITPPQQSKDESVERSMAILQAMREFAPGRVSRRFGIRHKFARYWVAPPDLEAGRNLTLCLPNICNRFDELGDYHYSEDGVRASIRCIRPYEIKTELPPKSVLDSSNAFLRWHSQICPPSGGTTLDTPSPSRWSELIREVTFFTHGQNSPVEVRRFSMGSFATINMKGGNSTEVEIRFAMPGTNAEEKNMEPVALGFSIDVDGIVVKFRIPENANRMSDTEDAGKLRSVRTSRFHHLISTSPRLDGIANKFQRGWLAQIYLSAITFNALEAGISIEEAENDLRTQGSSLPLGAVLDTIFQSIPTENEYEAEKRAETTRQGLHQTLRTLLQDDTVLEALHSASQTLWGNPDEEWRQWLEDKFKATLGGALLDVAQQLCPETGITDLIVDIDPGPRSLTAEPPQEGLSEIWLTETTLGGGGIVEKLLQRYSEDPRRFFSLLEAALGPSDFELADEQLSTFLEWAAENRDPKVCSAVSQIRGALSHQNLADALDGLITTLGNKGMVICHPVIAAINGRILRPGSTPETDRLICQLTKRWRSEEERLGIEIDARIFAYLCCKDDALDTALGQSAGLITSKNKKQWRFGAIYSLLWPRGGIAWSRHLALYNPFTESPDPDRRIVLDSLGHAPRAVALRGEGWKSSLDEALRQAGEAILKAEPGKRLEAKMELLRLMVEPVDLGYIFLYPRIIGVGRQPDSVDVRLELGTSIQ